MRNNSFRETQNIGYTYALMKSRNDRNGEDSLSLKGSTMNLDFLEKEHKLKARLNYKPRLGKRKKVINDHKTDSKPSTLRENHKENFSMMFGTTTQIGIKITKDTSITHTQTYQSTDLQPPSKASKGPNSDPKYYNFAVNSERDARIKRSRLLKGLKGRKSTKNYLTPNRNALQMKSNQMTHKQMKPVLVVSKVPKKENLPEIACQTSDTQEIEKVEMKEEKEEIERNTLVPVGDSMSTVCFDIPDIEKVYEISKINDHPEISMINTQPHCKYLSKKRHSNSNKSSQILEIQTQGISLGASTKGKRNSSSLICGSRNLQDSYCHSKGSKYNNDLPSQIFSPTLAEHNVANMQIKINPLRPSGTQEDEQGGERSEGNEHMKMELKHKAKSQKGRKGKLKNKLKNNQQPRDRIKLQKISKNIESIMKKLNFSFGGRNPSAGLLQNSNTIPKKKKPSIECVGSSLITKESSQQMNRTSNIQNKGKNPFISKSVSPFKKGPTPPLNITQNFQKAENVLSEENTSDLFPSTQRLNFPDAVVEPNLQIFDLHK